MKENSNNIFSTFDELLPRSEKEKLLRQHAVTLWLTGLSGSGKTTIAKGLERLLHAEGYLTCLLDGDNIRTGINNNLDFSLEARRENIRRIAEVSKLFNNCGVITINCFVSPTIEMRNLAKEIIGKDDFLEIFVDTPLEICEQRDVKGLYKKARRGEIPDFTGIHSPFEAPLDPDLQIFTKDKSIEDSVNELYEFIKPVIKR